MRARSGARSRGGGVPSGRGGRNAPALSKNGEEDPRGQVRLDAPTCRPRRSCRRHAQVRLVLGIGAPVLVRHRLRRAMKIAPPDVARRKTVDSSSAVTRTFVSARPDCRISNHRELGHGGRVALGVLGDADADGALLGVHRLHRGRAGWGVTAASGAVPALVTGGEGFSVKR